MTDSTAIEKAREALQFYADNNYDDGGEIARAALAALSSPEGEQTSGETRWKCPHGHEFGYAAGASPKWCPGCGTSSLSRAAAVPSAGGAAELAASSCKSDGTGCECGWPERECEVASKEGSVAPSSAAPRPFVGEGHKRPPEDYPEDARFKVPQQSIWIDGAKVTARNQDGWLTIAIETTDSVMGWALSYNGRDFPTTDDALRAALASSTRTVDRLLTIAEHLHAMVPREVWRDHGGDDGQGHYEGDYHAEKLADELRALRAASPSRSSQETDG